MSIARHHAEWLSLVPVSGPFLSLPVLMEAFGAGLEPHDPDHARLLRQEYSDWRDSLENRKADPAPYHRWLKFVVNQTLELDDKVLVEGQAISQTLQVEVPEHHEVLRPTVAVIDPSTKKPRLLVKAYPRSQELTTYVVGSPWKASPDTQMTELLHGTGVRLGLVTNGEHWMLVDAPKGETTGFASWYAALWLEEPVTLRAFRSLLWASRFFNVPPDQTLEALLAKSASNQQEVTDQLGYQVRRAVEVLIHSLDRADQDFGRQLLVGVKEEVLYEAALTIMMRLVFLFCAEERELIPSKPYPVYDENYSVSTISKQLRDLADQHGEELLERRYDAWPRLLATFRAVHGGLKHDAAYIPAYGGSLFNPDRFPFLEGRKSGTTWRETAATPLPVNNRTVLHLLEALQLLQVRLPGGGPAEARRLSFRALDIEQIGHVYEGLLDHTAKRATEPFLGLAGTREKEPELPLAELEKLSAKGESNLVEFLKESTGRTDNSLKKALKGEIDDQLASRMRTACQGDDELWKQVKPFASLVRPDSFGYPVIIPKGSVFVTAGTDRRSSGTHYTPRSLTEPIVQYTLEPLVYVGPAEGKPKGEWKLKSPKELLELKICDMACGSGAFLVQAARYMAERLMEAWDVAKKAHPNTPGITPEGTPSTGRTSELLIPDDPAERKTYAMRIIAQRCLYGVDKNPLAAEMAKLSLWLLTLAKDKPFEFLDHSIRCGDSLVGLHSIDQLRHYSLKPDADDAVLFKGPLDSAVEEAITLRLKLEDMPANTVEDVQRQEKLLIEANEKIARLRCAADMLVAGEFWGDNAKDKLERVRHAAVKSGYYVEKGPTEEFEHVAAEERRGQLMFHWPLEFPEVIVKRGGFDAFVGNPPFMGGQMISGSYGTNYRLYLVANVACNQRGSADLCAYFLLRFASLTSLGGAIGCVTTNTIAEGDTREVGLDQITADGFSIIRALPSHKWPGAANLEVAQLWLVKFEWRGEYYLQDRQPSGITPFLSAAGAVTGKPFELSANDNVAFQGTTLLGLGFTLLPDQAAALVAQNQKNSEVLFPYLNGQDLNSRADQSPSRYVINFRNWPLNRQLAPNGYKGPVAADYPDCLEIVERTVKPERQANNDKRRRELWWQFTRPTLDLYDAIRKLPRVLASCRHTKYLTHSFVIPGPVFDVALNIIAVSSGPIVGCLESSIYEAWVWEYGSSLRHDLRYTLNDCFNTFPFPPNSNAVAQIGSEFHDRRRRKMANDGIGITSLMNQFHDPNCDSQELSELRRLKQSIDESVFIAYGWTDVDLEYGFQKDRFGYRFTLSENASREVLQRLLKLNHERYAEEVKQVLHGKSKTKARKATKKAASSKSKGSLFDGESDE